MSDYETDKRRDVIDGLRMVADYLEARPDVPTPYIGTIDAFVYESDRLPAVARAMGSADKNVVGQYFELRRVFTGHVSFAVNFARQDVCERVVVGEEVVPEKITPEHVREIVEWKCPDSILDTGALDD